MTDELSAPLGRKRRKRLAASGANWPWGRISLGIFALAGLGIGAWLVVVDDPLGGRPVAEMRVETSPATNRITSELATPESEAPIAPLDVPENGPSIITLGDMTPAAAAEGRDDIGAPSTLVEMTSDGPLPRIAPDGARPYQAYARPSLSEQAAGGRKRIAVVMSGLGLNDSSTRDAITSLPGTVTLAFAPYGSNVTALAEMARTDGHEIMLEVPLEPFDYPQNDPGPHTLLVEQPPRENLQKLYWLMSRITQYTGLVNHMGARFTASAADFGPIMEELGLRGLSYLDDGSSNRSVAPQLARQNGVPYVRSMGVLDSNPSRSAILDQLNALKAAADENGSAIGMISALPVSIDTLAQWADSLDEEQYLLVPVSALATTQGQAQ